VLPVVVAGCVAVGVATNWSANGVAAVIAIGLAYLAVPPMVVALIEWQAKRAAGSDERAVQARVERSEAFRELWKIVQDAHLGVRNNFESADELSEVHRRLNVLLIEKAPALAESDVEMAHNFLTRLSRFIRLLRPLPGVAAEQIREDIADTAADRFLVKDVAVLQGSYARMLDCQEALRKRYQEVVFGE
jgi:hypothetical protein